MRVEKEVPISFHSIVQMLTRPIKICLYIVFASFLNKIKPTISMQTQQILLFNKIHHNFCLQPKWLEGLFAESTFNQG